MELYHANKVALYINDIALRKMLICVNASPFLECGGILLGKKECNWEKYYITDLGIPTKFDTQGSMSFVRDKRSAQRLIKRTWKESHGFVNHIGEWHSHIFMSPYPSLQDKLDMKRAFLEGETLFDHFFTLIMSSDNQIYIGLVERGNIIDSNVVKVEKECINIVQDTIRKNAKRR